jgi:hypothetical protein
LKKAEKEKNFKGLKEELSKAYQKKKRVEEKNKLSGQNMLKLLNLDNFSKYEKEFLAD